MCRSALLVVLTSVVLAAFATPSTAFAAAETRATLVAEQHDEEREESGGLRCPRALLICVGGSLVGALGGLIGGEAGDVVADGASAVGNSAMWGVVRWAADGAAWLLGEVVTIVDRSTRPQLEDAWFSARYDGMVQLACVLAALFLLLAVGNAIAAQDLHRLLRAAFVLLPCAVLLTFAAVTLTQIGLRVTDEMTAWVLRGSGDKMREAFQAVAGVFSRTTTPETLAPFVLFLSATITALLTLLIWLELIMREAAVYVAVAFLPLTLAAMIWERTAHWCKRLTEWLLAIILSKFAIAVAFSLAASAIADGAEQSGGLTAVLCGCAILLVAALTPWALLRLLPFAEAAAAQRLSPRSVTGAVSSMPGAGTAGFAARQLAFQHFVAVARTQSATRSGGGGSSPPPPGGGGNASKGSDPGRPSPGGLPQLPPKAPPQRTRERSR
jgi:hypothetical protein